MKKIIDALPLIVFASLIIVLFSFLSDKDDQLETALIDSSFPDFNLGSLSDESRLLTKRDIIKLPALINVWATWCINCKLEHGFLMAKKTEGWNIVGLNYKDDLEKAFKWLDQYGNPYSVNLYDQDGTYGFSLGVSGAPETYLLKEDKILQKHIGIMSEKVWEDKFFPLIKN